MINISRRKYFIIGVTLITVLSTLDLITTWIATPDLWEEANAFVRWYGFGWAGIILVTIAFIVFVSIPFYYHSLVFNRRVYQSPVSVIRIFRDYFLANHKNPFISIGKALFNALGFFLLYWYSISKLTAVAHNSFNIANAPFWDMPFRKKVEIIHRIDNIFLLIMMLIFIAGIVWRAKKNIPKERSTHIIPVLPVIFFFVLFAGFRAFVAFAKPVHSIELTDTLDPDIILINIGKGDRAYIAGLIQSIDSCKPAVIGIDVFFDVEKNGSLDSALIAAFSISKNDVIAYGLDPAGRPILPQEKFSQFASAKGLMNSERIHGLVSRFTPTRRVDNTTDEVLALKIIQLWKHGFQHNLPSGKSIQIRFTRTNRNFINIDGSDISNLEPGLLENKIVLLGYIGPNEEDKYYTPIPLVYGSPNDNPDMYGLVILANQIRTLLDYQKEKNKKGCTKVQP